MGKWTQLVNRSIAASLLIGLGDYALLKMGNPIGPVIFALGLLGVCYMGLNLFTGKCGFLFEDRIPPAELGMILLVNLVSGYVIGLVFSLADPAVAEAAVLKAQGWEMSLAFFIRSVLCGRCSSSAGSSTALPMSLPWARPGPGTLRSSSAWRAISWAP